MAGSVPRVSAADVEKLVVGALRFSIGIDQSATDRDLIERHLDKAIVHSDHISVAPLPRHGADAASLAPNTIEVPFTPTAPSQKGLSHAPTNGASLTETDRATLLKAIARSKAWIDTILKDPGIDFGAIAHCENLVERHVRFLAPLAFLSPRIVEAVAEGRASGNLNVSNLARGLPLNWTEQVQRLGLG